MFDKLRKAFSTAAKSIGQKEITEKVLDDALLDLQIGLLESDVAQEVVDSLSSNLKREMLGLKLEKNQGAEQIIQSKFRDSVAMIFARAGKVDVIERIRSKKESKSGPFTIVFLGINGTGKTTTVAKFANFMRKNGFSVVIAAGDTHRSGAIEQISKHAENLSIKIVAQRYGADPSAVGRDAVDYAKKHYVDVVLVDTAGRMQTSKNLMDEMSKIVRVVKPDMKLFIGDALAGNDTINQSKEFFQYTNFDGAILTKIDADAKGGAAISIAHITAKPILFVGIGQGYDDLAPFDTDKFLETLFGTAPAASFESLTPMPPQTPLTPAEEQVAPVPAMDKKEIPEEKPQVAQPAIVVPVAKSTPRPQETRPVEEKPRIEPEKSVREQPLPKPPAVEAEPPPPVKQPSRDEPHEEKKKGRFGLFGRKNKDKDKDKEKKQQEQKKRFEPDEEGAEAQSVENSENDRRKEDKDSGEQQEDKVIYLTDEDIEDLLK